MGGSNLMSAIAGRVLLIPKGNYDSTATYTMLDMVVYNGSSYICKQECTGVVPTNTTYWMLNASGSAVAYINDIGDVVITNPTNGQVLMYNSTTQKWVNGTISTTLSGLTDTQIASLSNGQVLKYNSTSQKWENAEDTGGILPHLIIISETGESVVKAVKGTTEIIATETSTGHYECDVPEFGTWTIHAVLGGDDATVNLVVDTVKVYTVDDSHFHADITVTYPSGATCNLAGQGESYYATSSPYTFTVHHAGQYTITVVYDGQTYTDTVTVTTTGQSFTKKVPTPSQAPANDINYWLWFGGVSGTFSTLEEILANSTALATLMASTDAVDYLVRCTDWASNDGLVPIMTSDTTPSGVCSSSSFESGYDPYKAFDGNNSTSFSAYPSADSWLAYEFTHPVQLTKVVITFWGITSTNSYRYPKIYNIQGYNGSEWVTLYTRTTNTTTNSRIEFTDNISSSAKYSKFRILNVAKHTSSDDTMEIFSMQLYTTTVTESQSAMSYIGLNNYCANTLLADEDWLNGICNSEYFESVLNVKVPVMTSSTTPSGVAIASSYYEGNADGSYGAWKAFNDGTSGGAWYAGQSDTSPWIQYKFTSAKKIKAFKIAPYPNSSTPHTNGIYEVLGSNNGTDFTKIEDGISITYNTIMYALANNETNYQYIRLHRTSKPISTSYSNIINMLQFYGREDV